MRAKPSPRAALAALVSSALALVFFTACGSDSDDAAVSGGGGTSSGGTSSGGTSSGGISSGGTSSGGTSSGGAAGTDASAGGRAGVGGGAGTDAGPGVTFATIHSVHRAIPGQMFGGWGPHLGHLVRAQASSGGGNTLWLVDDVCAPSSCDVLHDTTLGYYELTSSGWQERAKVTLPGTIQQNTATISNPAGTELHTFGIDVAASVVRECRYAPTTGPQACTTLPFTLLPSSNYIGAAISPNGSRLVWWTTVVDGGGGSFHYVVDYGGGWNGPRSGGINGYNDASYINIAFGGDAPSAFTMHAQLVSGLAPNWGFLGAVGKGDLTTTDAVTFQNALAAVSGDAIASTNDIWTDPASGDTHLIARTAAGAVAYFHRPPKGAWSSATFTLPATYRARFVVSSDRLVLVYGPNSGGLAWRVAAASDRPAGAPIAWGSLVEGAATLPAGFGSILAIYPESPMYQNLPAQGIHVALVGQAQENVVVHAAIE